MKNIILFI